jgi:peptidylprolyl isomerase
MPTPAESTAIPSPAFDPSAPVVLGAATVTGELGQEPNVQVDTTADPAVELGVVDIVPGTGATVQTGDVVTAHYVGYGATSGLMFDASWLRGEPATFPLDRVIAGWQLGLVGMQEGGRRLLVIPADMGYGQTPPEGSGIAPGETLIFVVDLVSIG